MYDFKNKVTVITGGGNGIGLAVAENFLDKNVKIVIILDFNETTGKEAEKKLNTKYGENKAVFMKCDVTNDLDIVYTKIVEEYKQVDILVNNAGVLDDTNVRKTINVNLVAVVEWSLKFFDHMRNNRSGGTIINMSSIYGFRVDPYLPIYKASKYGVLGFTKTLGFPTTFEKTGVRSIVLCPGFTRSNMNSTLDPDLVYMEKFDEFYKTAPWQETSDVGKAVVDIYETAESGTAWLIEGAKLEQI